MKDRVNFLNLPMDPWTMEETVGEVKRRIIEHEFTQHVVVNVAKVVNSRKDPRFREAIINCDIINIDGMGVVWGARFMGFDIPERVSGIDLFYRFLDMSAQENFPVFLLGAKQEVVEKTVDILETKYPALTIAGFHHGYFWDNEEELVSKISQSGAKLLFVAITSPKKENFINQWKSQLNVDFVMGVGGTFDVVAGNVKRAPVWMQKYGFEWLFRMIQEPGRMWKRYLVSNSVFAWILLKEKLK